jgi:hypothetical protein
MALHFQKFYLFVFCFLYPVLSFFFTLSLLPLPIEFFVHRYVQGTEVETCSLSNQWGSRAAYLVVIMEPFGCSSKFLGDKLIYILTTIIS